MYFFKEFELLKYKMPRLSNYVGNSINSDYNYAVKDLKNCYLLANAIQNQDCMYGRDFYGNNDCVDCAHISKCTLCYECLNCHNCYDCSALQDCDDCQNCEYSYDLKDCKNCIGCAGLRKKEFHIFNVPYTKEVFWEMKKSLTHARITAEFEATKTKTPHRFAKIISSENALGDNVFNSKNIFNSFDIADCQDIGYSIESKRLKDSWDISILEDSELCYEISSSNHLNNCNFCFQCVDCSNLEFCELLMNSHDCFGCVSRNHAEYEILNRKYSKDEYFKKIAEIKDGLKKEGRYGMLLAPTYPFADTVASWERM